ncbi:hypothetical protein [Mycolicibacter kumamotonensis]|uniref:hypothetical protein n=1 Tax=Mycolicibacter kumamotonensis TaxID=354243 RepID=UPI0023576A3D|nr:hypothetical protein [Mycolicibacter kumamotonensis]
MTRRFDPGPINGNGNGHPYSTWDAAYVLGSLSNADRSEFEAHLICRHPLSRGQGEAPPGSYPDGASLLPERVCVVSVSLATRGQTDIRGLATAGRGFGWIASACLASSVTGKGCS